MCLCRFKAEQSWDGLTTHSNTLCWIGESILISGAFSPFANTRYEAISMPALNIAWNNEILSAPKQDQTFPH